MYFMISSGVKPDLAKACKGVLKLAATPRFNPDSPSYSFGGGCVFIHSVASSAAISTKGKSVQAATRGPKSGTAPVTGVGLTTGEMLESWSSSCALTLPSSSGSSLLFQNPSFGFNSYPASLSVSSSSESIVCSWLLWLSVFRLWLFPPAEAVRLVRLLIPVYPVADPAVCNAAKALRWEAAGV